MSDPIVTNHGKTLHVLEVGDGSWGWAVWDPSDIRSCNSGVADSRKSACAAAEKAAGITPPEPPAPPAWMVEVAREVWEAGIDSEIIAIRALRLALERGHVVEPRKWTEEELLKGAREDASQALKAAGYGQLLIDRVLRGGADGDIWVTAALQARRNMLKEGAVVVTPVAAADLEVALKRAWEQGAMFVRGIMHRQIGTTGPNLGSSITRDEYVASALSSLPTREA